MTTFLGSNVMPPRVRCTYVPRHDRTYRESIGAGSRGPLPKVRRRPVAPPDDGSAPPETRFSLGWAAGWVGEPMRHDDIGYAAGWADGDGCRRRRIKVDQERPARKAAALAACRAAGLRHR